LIVDLAAAESLTRVNETELRSELLDEGSPPDVGRAGVCPQDRLTHELARL
jgi:hypothetical protein